MKFYFLCFKLFPSHGHISNCQFVLGSGDNLSDFTYVENVAHAHICAAEALISQNVSVAGKVI